MKPKPRTGLLLALSMAMLPAGCSGLLTPVKTVTTRPAGTLTGPEDSTQLPASAALLGTIGANVFVQGAKPMQVRGYGLVTRLAGQGSRNCPPSVREYLHKDLMRQQVANTPPDERKNLPSPNELIDSLDTAVVVVDGVIPPAAGEKQVFDVTIEAIDPDTRSLVGGYLLPCELKLFRDVGPAELITGKSYARARGPVFVNPFATSPGSGTAINLREASVIGGGNNLISRPLNLVSTIESYAVVRQIKDVINRRVTHDPPIADAVNPRTVLISPPEESRPRLNRFLEQLLYLPMDQSPALLETRAKDLVAELTRPEAPLNEVSLALEGIGKSTIPMLQASYTHPRKPVTFYSARAGLRLGDKLALDVLIAHAKDAQSPFRRQAIDELAQTGRHFRAAAALHELLDDQDARIRIQAYEALRSVDPKEVSQVVVGKKPENFLLEMVHCDGPPLIYARRTQIRRIALIGGERMACIPPLLFHEEDKPIVISADEGDEILTLLRRDRAGTVTLGPLKAPIAVAPLIRLLGNNLTRDSAGRIEGLDLDYGLIVEVLYRLAEKGAINAEVRWEEPSVEDVLGPLSPTGRPESEL